MKKVLFPAVLIILAACNSSQPGPTETAKTTTDSVVQDIKSPFPIMYSSKFAQGDPKNAESILTIWKDYADGNMMAHKELVADSLRVYAADGFMLYEGRDSALTLIQAHRSSYKSVEDRVAAISSLRSTDKNEDWVLIWGKEITTQKNGKVDSVNLMETWRFKNGKADLVYQYKMDITPPKK